MAYVELSMSLFSQYRRINPRIYLHYLLTQVHALRKNEVDPQQLLPHRISREILSQFADQEFVNVKNLFTAASPVA